MSDKEEYIKVNDSKIFIRSMIHLSGYSFSSLLISIHRKRFNSYLRARIINDAFFNCQLFTLAGVNDIVYNKDVFWSILAIGATMSGKTSVVLDVSDGECNRKLDCILRNSSIEHEVICYNPYVNGTGNKMHLYIIRMPDILSSETLNSLGLEYLDIIKKASKVHETIRE